MDITYINGYKAIKTLNHPNSMIVGGTKGWVYEHRLIMESEIGRYLVNGEEVHHLNGDKSDNRPANLIVVSKVHHTRLHNFYKFGLPNAPSKCPVCGKDVLPGNTYCSHPCSAVDKRKITRPCIDELGKILVTIPITKIAEEFGVSDNTIRKWSTSLGLPCKRNELV